MKLRFTPLAVENITAIAEYVRSHNPTAIRRVRAAIYDCLQSVLLFPRAGRRQKTEGVYKIVTRKYAYVIYYTIDGDEIAILSVRHFARQRLHEDI